jgi:DNA polymerase III subunit gamma/tau
VSTALYRRYRPETFADVIGQEHVTEPLMQALRTGRVTHAYLFSGPRGCGKTTSARILARCLNCEQGPTPEPCGGCDSCVALARGGPGTVDVIEIDAASHGGVDDARDLRERASYGPAASRYKVYIIDEAHMVSREGFNALLKIVEEPPEHVKFLFATTEPDKVIGTIRSRTHHYPFRLVPPARLQAYLEQLCEREGVTVAPGVLSFVVRAGGGSVRDSLSVLDQLIAGSGAGGLTYEAAAALLGFTDGELLDATVEAFAAGDAAAVFRAIDRVVETGLDPRRFVEDLLERLRDLIVVQAVGDGAAAVLRHLPEDQLERMRHQSFGFGAGELSRAADVVAAGLTEMTGATAPRLQLELVAARVLLPGAAGDRGYAARLDRIERRLGVSGTPSEVSASRPPGGAGSGPVSATSPDAATPGAAALGVEGPGAAAPGVEGHPVAATTPRSAPPGTTSRTSSAASSDAEVPAAADPASGGRASSSTATAAPSGPPGAPDDDPPVVGIAGPTTDGAGLAPADPATAARRTAAPTGAAAPSGDTAGSSAEGSSAGRSAAGSGPGPASSPGGLDTDAVRRSWPDVLTRLGERKRVTWTLVSQNAQVAHCDGERLLLTVATAGLAEAFRKGPHSDYVRQALIDVLGLDVRVDVVPADAAPPPSAASEPFSAPAISAAGPPTTTGPPTAAGPPATESTGARRPTRSADVRADPDLDPDPTPGPDPTADIPAEMPTAPRVVDDSAISADDESVDTGEVGVAVVERILGGTVIAEESG